MQFEDMMKDMADLGVDAAFYSAIEQKTRLFVKVGIGLFEAWQAAKQLFASTKQKFSSWRERRKARKDARAVFAMA